MRLMRRQRRRMRFRGWQGTLVLAILVLSATPTLGVLDLNLGSTSSHLEFCTIIEDDSDLLMPGAIGASVSVHPDTSILGPLAFSCLHGTGSQPSFSLRAPVLSSPSIHV